MIKHFEATKLTIKNRNEKIQEKLTNHSSNICFNNMSFPYEASKYTRMKINVALKPSLRERPVMKFSFLMIFL